VRTRANPVDDLLTSAAKHWQTKRPVLTIEEVDEQLATAVRHEKEMESWPRERWQQARDDHHVDRITRAETLAPHFASLARQQAICAALMPRYPEGSAERKTLKKLLEHLKADHSRMNRQARVQGKMSLREYRRMRFKHISSTIRELSDALRTLHNEWAVYNQEQADLATLAIVLDANRCTSVTTPA
jgi:DNA repair exonuclease SbcCD ATPase subunit